MPHHPFLRNHLSLAIIATLTLQAATLSLPRMAAAEDAPPTHALLVKRFTWATDGLAMVGEMLDVVHRSNEAVTVTSGSTEKPSMFCFPVDAAPTSTPAEPVSEQAPQNNSSQTPAPAPTPSPNPAPAPIPAPLSFSLNEAVSNPTSGKEWVEITVTSSNATKTDRALELWDAAGRIAQISAETDVVAGHLVVMLPSAKLNNDGDELSLRTPDGLTLAHTTIPSLEKGESWARNAAGNWAVTNDLTPGATNRFPAPPAPEPVDEPADETSPDEPQDEPAHESTEPPATENPVPLPTPQTPATPIGPHLPAFLSEAMSRPSDGAEWVELYVPTSAATTLGRELQLWDAAGRIATLGSDTPVSASGYVLVTLSSAKLNNSGDDLSLRTADGVVLDSTAIPSVDEGSSWARTDDGQWVASSAPTPSAANVLPSVAGASNTTTST
ncbi:MAG: Lamin Tail Domain, partial [Candidatus Parcubacteria bacterium]